MKSSAVSSVTCAPGASGNDVALCGFAMEGECLDGGDEPPAIAEPGQRVTCEHCLQIIQHVYGFLTPNGRVRRV